MTEDGIASASRLAGAHRAALTNQSDAVRLAYVERVGGTATGTGTRTLRVENGTFEVVSSSRLGDLRADRSQDGVRKRSDDGPRAFVHAGSPFDASDVATPTGPGPVTLPPALLAANDSRVVPSRGSTADYRIVTSGARGLTAENVTGTVFVTGDGLVRFGRWSFRVPDTQVTAVYTVRVVESQQSPENRAG